MKIMILGHVRWREGRWGGKGRDVHAVYYPKTQEVDEYTRCIARKVSPIHPRKSTSSETLTYSEAQKGEQRNGMRAEAPAQGARRGLRGGGVHGRMSLEVIEAEGVVLCSGDGRGVLVD